MRPVRSKGLRRLSAPLAGTDDRQADNRRGENSGVLSASKERTKESSGSQYFAPMPLIWNWSTPSRRQNC